jgi:hypothetical protein
VPSTTVNFSKAGRFTFTLTVSDDHGAANSVPVVVIVNEQPNEAPTAVADAIPDTVTLSANGIATTFLDGTASADPEGKSLTYLWSQAAAQTGASISNDKTASTNVNFSKAGQYTFSLTVKDDKGSVDSDTVLVTVNEQPNKAPVAVALAIPDIIQQSPNFEASTTLNGSQSSDPEGKVLHFLWSQDPAQIGASIIDEKAPSTNVNFSKAGTFKFTLKVTDEQGASDGTDVPVTVLPFEITNQKSCEKLTVIVDNFMQFNEKLSLFPKFKEAYQFYGQVNEYFLKLQSIQNDPPEDHLKFFAQPFQNELIQNLMLKWLESLNNMIIEKKDFRLPALELFRILTLLNMYIVCLQQKDIADTKVPMVNVFDLTKRNIDEWLIRVSQKLFVKNEVDVIKKMGDDMDLEITRTTQNGEETNKIKYMDILNRIMDSIKLIP